MGKFIDRRFYSEDTLCSTIATVRSRSLHIRIYNIKRKSVCFCMSVKCNRLMSAQTYSCRTVLSICTCIRQRMYIDRSDNTVLIRTCTYCDLHLMTRRRTDHGLISGEDHLGRTSCFPCYDRRINFTDRSLLCAETSADPWLDDTYFRSRDVQCSSHDSSYMERNLSGRQYDQSAEMIHITGCTECLHHGLLIGFCMIRAFYCVFTF